MAVKPEKRKLSKLILEMKFMKKSKEKLEKEQKEEEGKAMFASELTRAMAVAGSKVILEPSFVPCENLVVGRFSYRGMNPEIEKLTEAEKKVAAIAVEEKKPEDSDEEISDLEMARRYNTLMGTISNKFKRSKKRAEAQEPANKRFKFMKPQDD